MGQFMDKWANFLQMKRFKEASPFIFNNQNKRRMQK